MEQLLFRNAGGLRAVEIAEMCGVDRRTVYRDLSLLQDVGVPIYQKDGRFCLQRERYLATVRLSYDETVALLMTASTTQLENPHLSTAVEKLSYALPDPVAAHANVLTEMLPLPNDGARVKILDTLTRAWAEQRMVEITYRSRNNRESMAREVSIYFIEPKRDGSAYVVGFDGLNERVRAFKLDRIEDVNLLQSTYELPFHFDTKRYLYYLRRAKRRRERQDDPSV